MPLPLTRDLFARRSAHPGIGFAGELNHRRQLIMAPQRLAPPVEFFLSLKLEQNLNCKQLEAFSGEIGNLSRSDTRRVGSKVTSTFSNNIRNPHLFTQRPRCFYNTHKNQSSHLLFLLMLLLLCYSCDKKFKNDSFIHINSPIRFPSQNLPLLSLVLLVRKFERRKRRLSLSCYTC